MLSGMAKKEVSVQKAKTVRGEVMTENGRRPYGTKYTKEVHKKLVESVKKGYSLADAGLLAGLGRDTFPSWLHYGRHEAERYPHFAKLAADIEKARAERRADAVDAIVSVGVSQAPGSWQASAWFLERTDPENWGRKDKVEHVNDSPRQQINIGVLLDAETREAARDLLRRVAGNPGEDKSVRPSSRLQLEAGSSDGGGEPVEVDSREAR
jgi:hypothetical protein